jgi:hypothetical protein
MTGAFATHATVLLQNGYSPVPDLPGSRKSIPGWNKLREKPLARADIRQLVKRTPDMGLSVAGSHRGMVPIDIDTDDPAIMKAIGTALPRPNVGRKGSKGCAVFYRSTVPIPSIKFLGRDGKPIVEVLSNGKVTIPPSKHSKTGKAYRWLTKRTLFDTKVSDLVEITPAHIEALAKALTPWSPIRKQYTPPPPDPNAKPVTEKRMVACARAVLAGQAAQLKALSAGRNLGLYRATCVLGRFVHHRVLSHAEVQNALVEACKTNGYLKRVLIGQVLATIRSGLTKSRGDQLPQLINRPRKSNGYRVT